MESSGDSVYCQAAGNARKAYVAASTAPVLVLPKSRLAIC